MKQKVKSLKKQEKFSIKKEEQSMKKQAKGITLIALIITIVLNCSCLAMERINKLKKYKTSCIIYIM